MNYRQIFKWAAAVAAVLVIAVLVGCGGVSFGRKATGLYVDLGTSWARSVVPAVPGGLDIDHFILTGSNSTTGGSLGPLSLDGSTLLEDIDPGQWHLNAVARNVNGVALAEGATDVLVAIGQLANASILCAEYTDPSAASFKLLASWEPNVLQHAVWAGRLKAFDATETPIAFTTNAPACTSEGLAGPPLNPGWYSMISLLYETSAGVLDGSEVLASGRAEAVRIVSNYQTIMSAWYHVVSGSGSIDLVLDAAMHDEIPLTGSPTFSDLSSLGAPPNNESTWIPVYQTTPKTFNVTAPETVSVVYYLNGEFKAADPVGGWTLDAAAMMADEHYVVDVIAFSTDGQRAGSDSWIIKVGTVPPNDQVEFKWSAGSGAPYRLDIFNSSWVVVATHTLTASSTNMTYTMTVPGSGNFGFKITRTDSAEFEYWQNAGTQGAATLIAFPNAAKPTLNFDALQF